MSRYSAAFGPSGANLPRGLLQSLVMIFVCLAGLRPMMAQQSDRIRVVETIWGFDGRVVGGEFQPLSLLLDNLSGESIEGRLQLKQFRGFVRESGVVLEQDVFLGPRSRRWVQFYPYNGSNGDSWEIVLQLEDETLSLQELAPPTLVSDINAMTDQKRVRRVGVILDPPETVERQPTSIKHLNESVFPPYSTALHGLHALYLDRVPQWDQPQEQALLTWLQCGGNLFLLHDVNGQELRFTGDLTKLNEPFQQFRVGHGQVQRLELQREALTPSMVSDVLEIDREREEPDDPDVGGVRARDWANADLRTDGDIVEGLLREVRPQHNAALLLLLSLVYVAALYPGCWRLSKSPQGRFPRTHLAVLGLVISFALLFMYLGHRGYQESAVFRSLVVARHVDGTKWECLNFGHLFATSGGPYVVTDEQRQTLFAGSDTGGLLMGTAFSGQQAEYRCTIPPFSSALYLSRYQSQFADWDLSVAQVAAVDGRLSQLQLTAGAGFPWQDVVSAWVQQGNELTKLQVSESEKKLQLAPPGTAIRQYLAMLDSFWGRGGVPGWAGGVADNSDVEELDEQQRQIIRLVRRSLATPGVFQDNDLEEEGRDVVLIVVVKAPQQAVQQVSPQLEQRGFTVFARPLAADGLQ